MPILNILRYPDPKLRRIAEPVTQVDAAVRTLVDDMAETMYHAPGIGLAAIQVDVPWRIIVVDVSEQRNELLTLINPRIVEQEGAQVMEEGCLSVPGIFEPVERARRILLRAIDREGRELEREAEGLLAVCIAHEIDHLDGKVFVDYLSRLKQNRIRKKLDKQEKIAM
ncbi:MAG: peptide deformylase [Pseudomonadota bacterium]|nr:peptide deformylase [Pseudomonadota bacterium]